MDHDLPRLEAQHLDAHSEHEGKEDNKTNQDRSSWPHVVQVVHKMVFNIPFDGWVRSHACHLNSVFHVSVLCHNYTVHCPCHWANVVIPCPPLRNYLFHISKSTYKKILTSTNNVNLFVGKLKIGLLVWE